MSVHSIYTPCCTVHTHAHFWLNHTLSLCFSSRSIHISTLNTPSPYKLDSTTPRLPLVLWRDQNTGCETLLDTCHSREHLHHHGTPNSKSHSLWHPEKVRWQHGAQKSVKGATWYGCCSLHGVTLTASLKNDYGFSSVLMLSWLFGLC